jgi:hypothetical protein
MRHVVNEIGHPQGKREALPEQIVPINLCHCQHLSLKAHRPIEVVFCEVQEMWPS